jgi:hypothetical protein
MVPIKIKNSVYFSVVFMYVIPTAKQYMMKFILQQRSESYDVKPAINYTQK